MSDDDARRGYRTSVPAGSLRERLNGNMWPLLFALVFGGGGATAGAWQLVHSGESGGDAELARTKAELTTEKERRLTGIEDRLGKIEKSQTRAWRLLSGVAKKLKVEADDE